MPSAQGKGKSKTGSSSRDARRSRSRNTTPISSVSGIHQSVEPITTSPSGMQSTLNHLGSPSSVFIEEIFNNGGHNAGIPSPEALHSMLEEVKNRFLPAQTTRSEANEKFMRHLMQRRKARLEHQHAEERADREAEERKHKLKKAKKREPDEERPLAVGAHGVARQDGTEGKGRSIPYLARMLPAPMWQCDSHSFPLHPSGCSSTTRVAWDICSDSQFSAHISYSP